MESELDRVSHALAALVAKAPSDQRIVVCLAAIPGAGKTTLAHALASRLERAVVVGLDGWHCSRKELGEFDDPLEAHRRRGAPFTFNLPSYLSFLSLLSSSPLSVPIPYPTFSHTIGDPVSGTVVTSEHRIVLLEGLYNLLDDPGWKEVRKSCTATVWVQVEWQVARERLIERHVLTGVCSTLDEAKERVDGSDRLNAEYILAHSSPADFVIYSMPDPGFIAKEEIR